MRVSKTVREYIEKEVSKRLMSKYEEQKAEAVRRENVREEVVDNFTDAIKDFMRQYLEDACAKYPFLKADYPTNPHIYIGGYLEFQDVALQRWRNRFDKEVKEVADNIVIELELGGTKKDLERLLNEIGEG